MTKSALDHVFAVILAGGSGTRFWPASRRALPKQLLRLGPNAELPLIGATVARIDALVPHERILIATGADLLPATRRALPMLPDGSFLGEPVARNTAPCIGWAASIARRRDPDAVVMVLPSDHHIADEPGFRAVLERALDAAARGSIVTVGIEPTRPDTGYGYIELGEEVRPGVRRGVRFVEKPGHEQALEYLASGRYLWNGGMFFFRAARLLDEIGRHLPDLAVGLARIEEAAKGGAEKEASATKAVFETAKPVSIDVGVMEKVGAFEVVPANVGWSDLGSWESAWELAPKDDGGNASHDHGFVLDGQRNLLLDLRTHEKKRVMVALGVDDLCIVETDDALLVMKRERAQGVRAIVEALAQAGHHDKL
ncbi:MAG TPA: sugar phosphate nucleotidyltransferase [Polyangiaceae bacterium]|nr:sugar phosphate nucleotidyltransferase [Polyangiaceae bacterium]